jgi:D-glycero-D-manno-heptose 1,7-bisphosphate phosphatase
MKRVRAVILDRDGVLNVETGYLYRTEDLAWIPGAPEAVRALNEAGFVVVVVTNQAGVARGYYTEADVHRLHGFMQARLAEAGARIDAFYYSPYHPDAAVEAYRRESDCRKPATGLFARAVHDWHIDPARSFVVGDKNTDIEPGRALGMTTLLVETGYGRTEKETTRADHVVADLPAAVDRILHLSTPR